MEGVYRNIDEDIVWTLVRAKDNKIENDKFCRNAEMLDKPL